MAEVIWTVEAASDLEQIRRYVREFNPSAARHLQERLVAAANSLSAFPRRGRLGPHGTRVLPTIWPYLIFYEMIGEDVRILTIRHGARRPLD